MNLILNIGKNRKTAKTKQKKIIARCCYVCCNNRITQFFRKPFATFPVVGR